MTQECTYTNLYTPSCGTCHTAVAIQRCQHCCGNSKSCSERSVLQNILKNVLCSTSSSGRKFFNAYPPTGKHCAPRAFLTSCDINVNTLRLYLSADGAGCNFCSRSSTRLSIASGCVLVGISSSGSPVCDNC
jgi:hypothetical protein